MTMPERGLRFTRIPRHARVTQSLMAADGAPWYIAVARPDAPEPLSPSDVVAFLVTPPAAITLKLGAWHAGPLFGVSDAGRDDAPGRTFLNLELVDTNSEDYETRDFTEGPFPPAALRVLPPLGGAGLAAA